MPHLKEGQVAVQVVLERADKERFQRAAKAAGMPLSTWIRVQVLAALPRAKSARASRKPAPNE